MLSSKQRSYLRSLVNSIQPVIQIGKSGIDDSVLKQVEDAVNVREIVKINVLENSPLSSKEACNIICDKLQAEPVQVIGRKFTIYKRNNKKPVINFI